MPTYLVTEGSELLRKAHARWEDWEVRSYMFPAIFPWHPHEVICRCDDTARPSGAVDIDRGIEGRIRGLDAEACVYAEVDKLGQSFKKPLVAFRSIVISDLVKGCLRTKCPGLQIPQGPETEIDLVCIHENTGVAILEAKGCTDGTPSDFVDKELLGNIDKMKYRKAFLKSVTDCILGPVSESITFTLAFVLPFRRIDQGHETVARLRTDHIPVFGADDSLDSLFTVDVCQRPADWFSKVVPSLAKVADIARTTPLDAIFVSCGDAIRNHARILGSQSAITSIKSECKEVAAKCSSKIGNPNSPPIACLSEEQLVAWNSPTNHQFIRGLAGTGKSCLLMARIGSLNKCRDRVIAVYARRPSHLIYSRYAKRVGCDIICKPYEYIAKDFPKSVALTSGIGGGADSFSDLVRTFGDKMKLNADAQKELETKRDVALIVDDLSPEAPDSELEHAVQIFVASAVKYKWFNGVWVAGEFSVGAGRFLSDHCPQNVTSLRTVIRHARNIYQQYTGAYFRGCESVSSINGERSFIGHRCLGLTTRHIAVSMNRVNLQSFIGEVARIVDDQLDALAVENRNLRLADIMVLIDPHLNTAYCMVDELTRSLDGVQVETSDIAGQIEGKGGIAVDLVSNSCSIERDVVFYIKRGSFEEITNLDRLAMTRCVVAMITVSVH